MGTKYFGGPNILWQCIWGLVCMVLNISLCTLKSGPTSLVCMWLAITSKHSCIFVVSSPPSYIFLTDIEELTRKTGNFKSFAVFVKMLESAIVKVGHVWPLHGSLYTYTHKRMESLAMMVARMWKSSVSYEVTAWRSGMFTTHTFTYSCTCIYTLVHSYSTCLNKWPQGILYRRLIAFYLYHIYNIIFILVYNNTGSYNYNMLTIYLLWMFFMTFEVGPSLG